LVDEFDPIDLAAAALKIASGEDFEPAPEADYNFGETGGAPGMVRFFVNIGRSAKIGPSDLVKLISDEAGIPGKAIGKIDVFEKFTFVEVQEESAPFVFEALRKSRINGSRINLEPARPRERARK
jgi:ATP-dependent RNA helicase DeaD